MATKSREKATLAVTTNPRATPLLPLLLCLGACATSERASLLDRDIGGRLERLRLGTARIVDRIGTDLTHGVPHAVGTLRRTASAESRRLRRFAAADHPLQRLLSPHRAARRLAHALDRVPDLLR